MFQEDNRYRNRLIAAKSAAKTVTTVGGTKPSKKYPVSEPRKLSGKYNPGMHHADTHAASVNTTVITPPSHRRTNIIETAIARISADTWPMGKKIISWPCAYAMRSTRINNAKRR